MKIYTKIILDKDDNFILKDYYEYKGKIANAMGIHYDYKSTRSAKLMEKQQKREKKLLERKLKRRLSQDQKIMRNLSLSMSQCQFPWKV